MSLETSRLAPILVAAALLSAAGCDGRSNAENAPARGDAHSTVLLVSGFAGDWPTGLDPATSSTGVANLSIMNAIFGGLFQLTADDGGNAKITGVLAEGYEIRDGGRTVSIRLRRGVKFSDGTPFDAAAVRYSIERSLAAPCVCAPTGWPWAEQQPIVTPDEHTVELRFREPYGAVINTFPTSNVNWPISPTALRELGEEQFKMTPVGAGPFRVVANQLSTRVELERNPLYWAEGQPYLDSLVFQSVGSEQAGYQALRAGDAQALEGLTSTTLIEQAEGNEELTVTRQPPTSPYVIQLNTLAPPFDDQRAREAIYYATDVTAIRQGLFHGWYPESQSFTGPGGLFHHAKIPGYRTHDLEKARAIVAELGGLEVTLGTVRSYVAEQVITALQSQWQKAGIEVSIESYDLATLVQKFRGGWQAMLQTAGSYDPEAISGVSSRFRSDRPFTGVKDEHLDRLLLAAAGTFDVRERGELYLEAAQYISDKAYAPFLFAFAPTQVAAGGLQGPGLTTQIPPMMVNTGILWQEVRVASE